MRWEGACSASRGFFSQPRTLDSFDFSVDNCQVCDCLDQREDGVEYVISTEIAYSRLKKGDGNRREMIVSSPPLSPKAPKRAGKLTMLTRVSAGYLRGTVM